MTADEFRNALLLLNCIDADEFAVGLFYDSLNPRHTYVREQWAEFKKDPVQFYIHASAAHRNALWAIIEKRLTIGESND